MEINMNNNKIAARIAGALFLIAMVTSLVGGNIISSILGAPDYLTKMSVEKNQMFIGVILEFINGISVVGIAVMLAPIIRKHNDRAAIGYVSFRILEAISCIIAAIIPLSNIALSREYIKAGNSEAYYQTIGTLLSSARTDVANLPIPVFFSLGALILYSCLFTYKLVPRPIAAWGFISVIMILIANLLQIGFPVMLFIALPMILNEIFLGVWLIVKGIKQ